MGLPLSPLSTPCAARRLLLINTCNRATEVLAEGLPKDTPRSFHALADHCDVSHIILQHRARGRVQQKARSQQYLVVSEETAIGSFLLQQDAFGRPLRIKLIPSIAFAVTSQHSVPLRPHKPPGKNWTLSLRRKHAAVLKVSNLRELRHC